MNRSSTGSGIMLALLAAVISGVSVYVAKFGTQVVPDPFVYTTARNLTVGLALLVGLVVVRPDVDPRVLSRTTWLRLGAIAVVGGSVPFLLFFWGLTMTSAATGSLIQKTEFVWVAILAAPVLGEKVNRLTTIGLGALLVGTAVQGPLALATPGTGVALVLAATLLWAIEAVLVRRALREVSPRLAATARMAGGSAIMVVALALTGRLPVLVQLNATQVLWVVVPSVLLLCYVLTWFSALRAAPATVVTSLLALGAPITVLLGAGATSTSLVPNLSGSILKWSVGIVPIASTVLVLIGCALLIIGYRASQGSMSGSAVPISAGRRRQRLG